MLCSRKAVKQNNPESELRLDMISQLFVSLQSSSSLGGILHRLVYLLELQSAGLDPADPKLPQLMWVGSCSVGSLRGRRIAVLKP